MAVEIPHFAFPFRFVNEAGRVTAAVNEQDSYEDVFDSARIIAAFPRGWIEEEPDFGLTDQTFFPRVDMNALRSELLDQEPRVVVLITDRVDLWDELKHQIIVDVFKSSEG